MSDLRADPDFDTFQYVSGNVSLPTVHNESPEGFQTPRKGVKRSREELLTGAKREWLRGYEVCRGIPDGRVMTQSQLRGALARGTRATKRADTQCIEAKKEQMRQRAEAFRHLRRQPLGHL